MANFSGSSTISQMFDDVFLNNIINGAVSEELKKNKQIAQEYIKEQFNELTEEQLRLAAEEMFPEKFI